MIGLEIYGHNVFEKLTSPLCNRGSLHTPMKYETKY